MNQKKCPKCGELNPAEAVMCWACYTPLSGAPGAGPPGKPPPGFAAEEKEKKAIPPWQLGIAGIALLGALGFGAKTMFGGGGGGEDEGVPPITISRTPVNTAPASAGGVQVSVPAPAVSNTPPGSGDAAPPPKQARYSVVAAPNPTYSWGTMAIVPSDPQMTPSEAAALAVFARQQMMRNKKWAILHIYVFADRKAGLEFRTYQQGRNGRPLEKNDYNNLVASWPKCLARYEYNQGAEGFLRPGDSPSGWWNSKTIYIKAQQRR